MIRTKIMREIKGKNWVLLGHYMSEYPCDKFETLNRILDEKGNKYSFTYNSEGDLEEIHIATNGQYFGEIYNFFIKIRK